ncbi:MAG: TetR/AcrR family transcriptional regulator [Nevskiaceae bacterium]
MASTARAVRRRRRNKAARPAELLEAAIDVFAQRGYAATRIEDVARRAGVAKGTVYVYFRDKEALFQAAVRHLIGPAVERIEHAIDSFTGSSEELLRLQIGTFYRQIVGTRAPALVRLLIAEGARFPELARFYHREVLSRGMAALSRTLARGVARQEFHERAAIRHPQILMGPALAAAMWTLLLGKSQPLDLAAYEAAHLEFVLAALARRQGGQRLGR